MKNSFVCVIGLAIISAGLLFANVSHQKKYTPENTVVAWDFHDVIAHKPIAQMAWSSIKILKDAENQWDLIKLLCSPSFAKEVWYGPSEKKSSDRLIEFLIERHPHELAVHKEKIYAVANMHYMNPEVVAIITQLKNAGYVQVLASNIGSESLGK